MNEQKTQVKKLSKESQSQYAKKYNAVRASKEEYCEACKINVKLISLTKHKQGQKHIKNLNNNTGDKYDFIYDKVDELKTAHDKEKVLKDIYVFIKNEFFKNDVVVETKQEQKVEEIIENYITNATTLVEVDFCKDEPEQMLDILQEMNDNLDTDKPKLYKLNEQVMFEIDKIEYNNKNTKQKLLDIFRKLIKYTAIPTKSNYCDNSEEEPGEIQEVEEPKQILKIKTIDTMDTKQQNKKVEFEEVITLEVFPTILVFSKLSNINKEVCLLNICENHNEIDPDNTILPNVKEAVNSNSEDQYLDLYSEILFLKEQYDFNNIPDESEEQYEEYEEEQEDEEDEDY